MGRGGCKPGLRAVGKNPYAEQAEATGVVCEELALGLRDVKREGVIE